MVSQKLINKYKLDQEEIDLIEDDEKDFDEKEYENFFEKSMNNLKKKDKVISLRVNSFVIDNIKKKAEYSGLNYQTLINVLLKQYALGKVNIVL